MSYRRVLPILLTLLVLSGVTRALADAASYAYVFDTTSELKVARGASVSFGQNGAMSSDMSHPVGAPGVTVQAAGTYRVSFHLMSVSDFANTIDRQPEATFCIQVNGATVPGATFRVANAFYPLNGDVVVALKSGDVVSLCNQGDGARLGWEGKGAVTASMTIMRL